MHPAVLQLLGRSAWNSFLVKLRRLREPKYFIAMALGLVWLGSAFAGMLLRPRFRRTASPVELENWALFLALGLAVFLPLAAWIVRSSRGALAFSENEAAWLFASPLGRGTLFAYHFIKPQVFFLPACIFAGLGLSSVSGFRFWAVFAALWLGWNLWLLHCFSAALFHRKFEKRPALLTGFRLLAWGYILLVAEPLVTALAAALQFDLPIPTIAEIYQNTIALHLLAPFRLIVAPGLARDAAAFGLAAFPVLGLGLLHFWWIVACKVPWEEATMQTARLREERLSALRRGEGWKWNPQKTRAREELFRLAPTGSAAPAFLWKWGVKTGGRPALRKRFATLAGFAVLLIAGVVIWNLREGPTKGSQMALLMLCGMITYAAVAIPLLFVFPAKNAQQFRAEIDHMDVVFTLPVPPRDLLLGMLSGPILSGIVYLWLMLALVAGALWLGPHPPQVTAAHILAGYFAASLVLSALLPAMTLLQCLFVLLFPGWQPKQARAGFDNLGIGLIAAIVIFMILFLTLGIAALVCVPVYFLAGRHLSIPAWMVLAGLVATAVIAVEAWVTFRWTVLAFRRYDPSDKTTGVRKRRS